jgi:hypothetical protein
MSKDLKTKFVVSFKSSSVGVSVVSFENKIPKIMFVADESLMSNIKINTTEFIENSLNLLKKIIKDNSFEISKNIKHCNDCEVILNSPWFLPELVSKQNSKVSKNLKIFFQNEVEPPLQKDYVQIENKITNILVNGYHLTKLRDLESDDIKINLYRSYILNDTAKKIKDVISSSFKQINRYTYSSSAMMIYESLKNLFVNDDNFIAINISGEVTEISVVLDDIIHFFTTVPGGSHYFYRELETFLSDKKNLNSIKFFANDKVDEQLDKNNKIKIDQVSNKWIDEVFGGLSELNSVLPKKVFIFSNPKITDFVKMILNNHEVSKDHDFFHVISDVFSSKIKNQNSNYDKNVEFLLSAYYLSIKS